MLLCEFFHISSCLGPSGGEGVGIHRGELQGPSGIAVFDAWLYVAEQEKSCIQVYTNLIYVVMLVSRRSSQPWKDAIEQLYIMVCIAASGREEKTDQTCFSFNLSSGKCFEHNHQERPMELQGYFQEHVLFMLN